MNVGHRHSVPFSLTPDGPIGLGHMKKDLPQLTPGFLVNMLAQGSLCSHFGTTLFESSFDHDSLAATVSIKSFSVVIFDFEGDPLVVARTLSSELLLRFRFEVLP